MVASLFRLQPRCWPQRSQKDWKSRSKVILHRGHTKYPPSDSCITSRTWALSLYSNNKQKIFKKTLAVNFFSCIIGSSAFVSIIVPTHSRGCCQGKELQTHNHMPTSYAGWYQPWAIVRRSHIVLKTGVHIAIVLQPALVWGLRLLLRDAGCSHQIFSPMTNWIKSFMVFILLHVCGKSDCILQSSTIKVPAHTVRLKNNLKKTKLFSAPSIFWKVLKSGYIVICQVYKYNQIISISSRHVNVFYHLKRFYIMLRELRILEYCVSWWDGFLILSIICLLYLWREPACYWHAGSLLV